MNIKIQFDNKSYITENNYDAKNQLLSTKINGKASVEKQYDANGNEVMNKEVGVEVRNTYDELNRVVKLEIPSASKENEFVAIQDIEYDEVGNEIKKIDANGSVEIKKYDANNNVIEETNKNGIETLYEYDGQNNLLKVQNHKDRYVSYTYDKSNNVTFKKINDKYAEYKYDENSNLVYEEDENKYITKYEYDVFDRKVNEVKPDGSNIYYTYDNLGNKISENNKKFTYDRRNNLLTATNKEGSVKNTYDAFNHKISTKDTNGNVVKYRFNEDNRLSRKDYEGIQVNYTYNDNGLLETIKKGNEHIAKYEYNNRNEIIKLTQKKTITQKTYDDMGRVLTQVSSKDGMNIFDAKYTYDANDNLIKEVIDGKENTYAYDEYDELKESHKYINNKLITTTYKNDVFGNRMESSSSEGKKTYKYNERNQVESIETKDGVIKYNYDSNGNVSKKVNEDGRVDLYKYDEFNQLVQLDQDRYVYDYKYDAENERVQQIKTDTKDYHYDQWYDYNESLELVEDKEIDDVFKNLQEQVKKKKKNNDVCDKIVSDTYDVTYFKEPEVTKYTLDRNKEYTEVLKDNDGVYVFGETLLQSNGEDVVTGWNNSVIAKLQEDKVKKVSYRDYGTTKDINKGYGYNAEMLDESGLIYLRARYYDPNVSRFVQIDTHYDGEKENVASQNKYIYTLSNPYKYVDRNGKKADYVVDVSSSYIGGKRYETYFYRSGKKEIKLGKEYKKKKGPEALLAEMGIPPNSPLANIFNKLITNKIANNNSNKSSNKGGGSQKKKPSKKKVSPKAKCPEKEKSTFDSILDKIQEALDWAGWIPFPIGDIADGLNALISFIRGNVLMAIINIACLALPAAIMAGAKQIGKACSSAAEFISKLSPKAQGMVKTVRGFVTGLRDAVGKIIWLLGEKIIRPIMNKLDDFAGWIGDVFKKGTQKKATGNTGESIGKEIVQDASKGASGASNKNIRAEDLNLSETVKNHLNDTVSKNKVQIIGKDGGYITIQEAGDLTRPYINSNQTIQSIIDGGTPVKDAILNNGLKWNVPGTFRGTSGTWELVVDMDSNTIVHFLFNGR